MWYTTFFHKLKYDELPRLFPGLTFERQDKFLIINGPKSANAKKFMDDFLRRYWN